MNLNPNHPAVIEGRTIHTKRVKNPSTYKGKVLKSVADNIKLGNGFNVITKGDWIGLPMFSLTLEERKTCPRSCHHWRDCYGNNTAFSIRFEAGKDLEDKLKLEVDELAKAYPMGFVIRLHVLGDFYSLEYVRLWESLMVKYPKLRIFGYTSRKDDLIGIEVQYLNLRFPARFKVRQSSKESDNPWTAVEVPNAKSLTCPQQTGKAKSCVTCSLCWEISKPIHFITH